MSAALPLPAHRPNPSLLHTARNVAVLLWLTRPRSCAAPLIRPLSSSSSLATPSLLTSTQHIISLLTHIMAVKKRCQLQAETPCNSAVLRIVGQCPHCRVEFCGAHRLPEHHNCNKLEDCRQQAFERNKAKLESERTVASKMATA